MKTIYVDANSRTSVVGVLGFGKNYVHTGTESHEIDPSFVGLVRFYNYGDADGTVKIKGETGDGMKIPAGHVEYIGIPEGATVEISGSDFNVM